MAPCRVVAVTTLAIVASMIGGSSPSHHPRKHSIAAPWLVRGPNAVLSTVAGPGYSVFTCQVVGFSGATCYDPYQMRHAYGVDTLIASGFDGTGKTIVIVDAFQSPNIVQQLTTYNTFYGLPGLNGLGGPPNASLGTFTQIAPDGLTPFVPGDPDMIGWAEEISTVNPTRTMIATASSLPPVNAVWTRLPSFTPT